MASDVSICNLALGHLGDEATVTSIDPAEGSQQAEHCQRYNTVLESHEWGIATRRRALVELSIADEDMPAGWTHAYAKPNGCLRMLSVLSPYAAGQTVFNLPPAPDRVVVSSEEQGEEFIEEVLEDGQAVLYTNASEAVGRFIELVEDTTKYSALMVNAIARLLASMLAGPIIKGTEGMRVGAAQLKQYMDVDLPLAKGKDANARRKNTYNDFVPSSIAARR